MSTRRPFVLDLCCCAGGATKGYQRAGLQAIGVDIEPRPNYCGQIFEQADALAVLDEIVQTGKLALYGRPDLIHMSWPCQERCTLTRGTNAAKGWGGEHPQLVPQGRALAELTGIPYVIEQPSNHGGIIRTDLMLCTDMFHTGPPPWIQRHRDFELHGFTVEQPKHPKGPVRGHRGYVRGYRGRSGDRPGFFRDGNYVAAYGNGGGKATVPEMQHALGIDWTDVREELTEAIPPVYTEFIGRQFLASRQPALTRNGA